MSDVVLFPLDMLSLILNADQTTGCKSTPKAYKTKVQYTPACMPDNFRRASNRLDTKGKTLHKTIFAAVALSILGQKYERVNYQGAS